VCVRQNDRGRGVADLLGALAKAGLSEVRNVPFHGGAAVGRHAYHPAGTIFFKLFRECVAHGVNFLFAV
jgi:hypothetical protein